MEKQRKCRVCGCTDNDCRQCIEAQGVPMPLGRGGSMQQVCSGRRCQGRSRNGGWAGE